MGELFTPEELAEMRAKLDELTRTRHDGFRSMLMQSSPEVRKTMMAQMRAASPRLAAIVDSVEKDLPPEADADG